MSIEIEDIIEFLVGDNNDVDEVLRAMDENWCVAERLHYINEESVEDVVFDEMPMEEMVDKLIETNSVEDLLDHMEVNHKKEFYEFISNLKSNG